MKILHSFRFAFAGIKSCFKNEINFKVHIIFLVVAVLLGAILKIAPTEWVAIIVCMGLVLAMEMINTAIETLCNIVYKDFHPAIKKIKDIAAGAVLVVATCSFVTGAIIFVPKIVDFIKSF
jgi:undecaprenol kinase